MKVKIFKILLTILATLFTVNHTFAKSNPNLKWVTVPEINFNFSDPPKGTAQQKSIVRKIWGKEISGSNSIFVLLAGAETSENIYYISILLSQDHCPPTPNGSGKYSQPDLFTYCPARVWQQNKKTKAVKIQNFKDFCYLEDDPRGHTEFAFDETTNIAHLKTMQYGKFVPDCARAIRLR